VAESDSSQVKAAKIAAAATIVAALLGLLAVFVPRIGDGGDNGTPKSPRVTLPDIGPGAASVFLNTNSGPAGSTIRVSGTGFAANEEVVIRFHTDEVGSTTANDEGKFENVAVTVPASYSRFAPNQFSVIATGRNSLRSDQAPFTVSG
jgi:hypothetical protein